MRDRMIRASFWPDKKICELSNDAQLVYVGIWGAANDYGVAPADPHLLKNEIDKRNTRWSMEKFKKCIAEISTQKMIVLFTHGLEYFYFIPAFTEHQRNIRWPVTLDYPEPPSDYLTTPAGSLPEDSPKTNGTSLCLSLSRSLCLSRSSVEEKTLAQTLFARFWSAYPKKKSKGQAEKVWVKLNPSEELLTAMLSAIEKLKQSRDWQKENGQFIPYPSTWLNAKGWEDEVIAEKPYSDTTAKNIQNMKGWLSGTK